MTTQQVTKAPQGQTILQKFAKGADLSPGEAWQALESTIIPKDRNGNLPSKGVIFAFLAVAAEHRLNPFLKQIFAFESKGGISAMVSIDGWYKMANAHPAFDGFGFDDIESDDGKLQAVECTIYRKDRTHPHVVREYLDECKRNTEPWKKWPRRMLRHKAFIQCARAAFSFAGIYDEDEAERIAEAEVVEQPKVESMLPAIEKSEPDEDAIVQAEIDREAAADEEEPGVLSDEEADKLDVELFDNDEREYD